MPIPPELFEYKQWVLRRRTEVNGRTVEDSHFGFERKSRRLLLVDGYEYNLRTGLLTRDGKRVRLLTGSPFERAGLIRHHIEDSRKGKGGNQPDKQIKVTHNSERL